MIRRKQLIALAVSVLSAASLSAAALTHQSGAGEMPDRQLTPGSADARVTQATIRTTICVPGYTATVRDVPLAERKAVFAAYHVDYSDHARYELDHLISLELGGDNTARNLWPEPYAGDDGARAKDAIETRLKKLVCAGTVTLSAARRAIATDWRAAARRWGGAS